ncbi:hypothetical protein Cgig2_000834 [Carnegiea gigantea]|uniref:Uncharacterized protein n=1 Tax=Carnegiea gigantea TaxID=171969 RepID=A0A9Q1QLL6_9CARY|nr:hypothetical protein Cgig2_000834 [Carnegiea gigantea]
MEEAVADFKKQKGGSPSIGAEMQPKKPSLEKWERKRRKKKRRSWRWAGRNSKRMGGSVTIEQNCADCLDVVGVASCGYYILWLGKLTDLRFNLSIVVQVIPNPFCRSCCGPVCVSVAQECHPGGCCGFGGWGFWFGVTIFLSKIKRVAGSIILMEIHLKN